MNVFLDTSAIYALLDRNDKYHQSAYSTWSALTGRSDRLVTTNYVVLESATLLQRRLGLDAVADLQNELLPVASLHWIDPDVHAATIAAILELGQRQLSLVDYSSFLVMRRLGIRRYFGFDSHFTEHGFESLS